jgi:hypothetical protein
MQLLEARVAYLERLLHESRPDVALDHLGKDQPAGPSSDVEPARNARQTFSNPSPSSRFNANDMSESVLIEADDPGTNLASDVAFLALSASGREPQYFGPSSALSFSRIASTSLGLRQRHGGSQVGSESNQHSQPSAEWKPVIYPSPSMCEKLYSAYFGNVHPQYPFLHRPTFDTWKMECMRAQLDGTLESVHKVRLFFVLMVWHTTTARPLVLADIRHRFMLSAP